MTSDMKKLRDFYFIVGLAALVFAILTRHVPGVTVTDFVQGFCYGLALTMFLAGLITALIPTFYKGHKKEEKAPDDGIDHPETPDASPKP